MSYKGIKKPRVSFPRLRQATKKGQLTFQNIADGFILPQPL